MSLELRAIVLNFEAKDKQASSFLYLLEHLLYVLKIDHSLVTHNIEHDPADDLSWTESGLSDLDLEAMYMADSRTKGL